MHAWKVYSSLVVLTLSPLIVYGAVEAVETPLPEPTLAGLITGMIPVLIPFVVYGFRRVLPKIPRVALPVLASLLGVGAQWLVSLGSSMEADPVKGAVLGALAVFVREVYSTIREHGLKP